MSANDFYGIAVKRLSQEVTSPGGLVRVVRVPVTKILPNVLGDQLSWAIRLDDLIAYEQAIQAGYGTDFTVPVPDRLNRCVMAVMTLRNR